MESISRRDVQKRVVLGLLGIAAAIAWIGLGAPAGAHDSGDDLAVSIVPVVSGLSQPTAVEISSDGRFFILEKDGKLKVANGEGQTATTILDIQTEVHSQLDRGLLGLALHPDFPANDSVYVSYTYDAPIGGTAPTYGNGNCPNPDVDGCPATGKIVKLRISPSNQITSQQTLVQGAWCYQFPTHSLGDLVFGPDGALYVSSGEGASPVTADYGQIGSNPCGDPSFEGGAVRSQDLETNFNPTGDPITWSGAIVRLDPNTGEARSDNPLVQGQPQGTPSAADDPIIAYGLRNPYRLTFRPGTNDLWIGDVGWGYAEEINVHTNPDGFVENFGWPCYEGSSPQGVYQSKNIPICNALYSQPARVEAPYYAYVHESQPGGTECQAKDSAISSLEFINGSPYPTSLDGSLVVADYGVGCIWLMEPGGNGLPDPGHVETLATGRYTTDITRAPNGSLYLVDIVFGTVSRLDLAGSGAAPIARVTASPPGGSTAPLSVTFDARTSSGTNLSFAWDVDNDGEFDDGTGGVITRTLQRGTHLVSVRASSGGFSDIASVSVPVNNNPPTVTITSPPASATFSAGDVIVLDASASDPDGTQLTDGSYEWQLLLHHCTGQDCHQHFEGTYTGRRQSVQGSSHPYPSYLEAVVTVHDGMGGTTTASREIQPVPATLTVTTDPPGGKIQLTPDLVTTPASQVVIAGSELSISAPARQVINGQTYGFVGWSQGGPRSQEVTVSTDMTVTARYALDNTSVTVTPSTIVMPDTFVGQTTTTNVTVTTSGPAASVPGYIESAIISGAGLALGAVPDAVPVNTSATIPVTFSPTVSGSINGQATLVINGKNYTVPITANANLAPIATLQVPSDAGEIGRIITGVPRRFDVRLAAVGEPYQRPIRITGASSTDSRVSIVEVPTLINVGETGVVTISVSEDEMGEFNSELVVLVGLERVTIALHAGVSEATDSPALFDPTSGRWQVTDVYGSTRHFYYGNPGDLPLLGDWDCDGFDTPGMFRPSNGFVYITNRAQTGVADREFFYGQGGDIPIVGDWNNNGCDTLAIYRSGEVFVRNSLGTGVADYSYFFGDNGDRPFAGDFDGDGVTSVGLYRETTGFVYFRDLLTSGKAEQSFFYGIPSDKIIAGDYDGDRKETVGIFRPLESRFYLSNVNAQRAADLMIDIDGASGWIPTVGLLPI
ncbi:MAG: PQQ-dependent sugar dehydrogenase [Acidimicrobiia bacterium]|nr:PQQ-dependent sugar dehydrogenase [Acidimicrobiia bacterium]